MMSSQQKGNPIYKKPCPKCKSSDANQVFSYDNKPNDSWCFACETYFPSDDSLDKVVPIKQHYKKVSTMEIEDIKKLPIRALEDRKIRKETCAAYRVRVAVSEEDGETITSIFSPDTSNGELVGYEQRIVATKQFFSIGNRKGKLDLFGKHFAKKCASKKLIVTEGVLDCLSLYQCILENSSEKYKHLKPSVVSITGGCSSAVKSLVSNKDFIDGFEELILCFDNDQAGERATKEVLKVFPLAKVATLPLKDASDMLVADKSKELFQQVIFRSAVQRQGEVVDVSDIIENAMTKPQMGISFPWDTVTKACFGIREGTIHCVGAAPKIGKTDHQHQLVHHLVYNEKVKVGMFDLENSPVKTAKKLASKQAKKDFTRPDTVYQDSELRQTLEGLDGKVRFYDRAGSRDWEAIQTAITEMHLLDGINIFMIDPMTTLVQGCDASQTNTELGKICSSAADLVSVYPITIFFYSHVNPKPKGSTPHEKGARVYSSEFFGSRSMERFFHYGHGISRDRSDECPEERKNMSEFYMLFDRDFGQSYTCDVYFDESTVTYLEPMRRSW
tara:strand:- start:1006 stop:2682 length:1677 start_codon:yes stop_codon:yes gene_type:complete